MNRRASLLLLSAPIFHCCVITFEKKDETKKRKVKEKGEKEKRKKEKEKEGKKKKRKQKLSNICTTCSYVLCCL
jgi:hypothetical protein